MLVDTNKLAERWSMKPKTLHNWRCLGIGPPYIKVGFRVLYEETEIEKWMAERRRTSTSDKGQGQAA